MSTKTLRTQRAAAYAAAVGYLKAGLSSENRSAYDKAMSEVETLGRAIEAAGNHGVISTMQAETREISTRHAEAFDRYLRGGLENLTPEDRKALAERERRDGQTAGVSTISQSTGAAGGYLVPVGFANEIDNATKWYAQLMDSSVCRTLNTESGATLPYPTADDTSTEGELLGETSGANEGDLTFGVVNFHAFKYSSKLIKVSSELMQDSYFNLYAYIAEKFGERLGRAYEKAFTNGNGTTAPQGFLTAIAASGAVPVIAAGSSANDGITGNTGVNSIGSQDLVNLEFSVDRSYRRNAKYAFHDNTLSKLKGMLDKFGRPLWTPGVAAGEPDRINGYEYVIINAMPTIAASAVTVAFGDFSKFVIRKISTPSVKRLTELYAVNDQTGFVCFQRVDSRLVDAGTHPLNVLSQHS